MKLADLVVKIADLEKEIAAKSAELSLLTSQQNSIMLSLPTSGGSSSAETFGGLLDQATHAKFIFLVGNSVGMLYVSNVLLHVLRLSSYKDFFFFPCSRREKKKISQWQALLLFMYANSFSYKKTYLVMICSVISIVITCANVIQLQVPILHVKEGLVNYGHCFVKGSCLKEISLHKRGCPLLLFYACTCFS